MNLRYLVPLIVLLTLTFAAGCDDPASAGHNLIETDEAGPRLATQRAETIETTPLPPPTTGNQERALAGHVTDPIFGEVNATGYLDYAVSSRPDAFDDAELQSATLLLRNEYAYGDTTAPVTLELRPITADWEASGAPADTSLDAGTPLTTFSFHPADTLVSVPLPEDWVTDNQDVLLSETFTDDFHGFKFTPTQDVQSVAGFAVLEDDALTSRLRLETEDDTAFYPASKTLTELERLSEPSTTAAHLPIQAGVGPAVRLDVDLSELADNALNRGIFRLRADTTALIQQQPEGFVRPLLRTLEVYGVQDDGEETRLALGSLNSEGYYVFQSSRLRSALQAILLGELSYDHYRVNPYPEANTINASLLYSLDAAVPDSSYYPSAVLTLTPLN